MASAKGAASMIVGCIETVGRMRYGEPGGMEQLERKMATDGLTGSLARLPAETTRQIADLSAPVMAAFGFMMYAARLSTLEARRRASKQEDRRAEAAAAVSQAHQIANEYGGNGTYDPQTAVPSDGSPFQVPNLDDVRGMQAGGM